MTKLLYIVSHPIQYQAPLLKLIAKEKGLSLKVLFDKIPETGSQYDPGFNRTITWDIPLLDGYEHDTLRFTNVFKEIISSDIIWFHGWELCSQKLALLLAIILRKPIMLRCENNEISMPDPKGIKGIIKKIFMGMIRLSNSVFLSIGTMNKQYYINRAIPEERIFLMPYAVDNNFFDSSNIDVSTIKTQLNIPLNSKVVLYSGKLMKRKNPDILLKAWNNIKFNGSNDPYLIFVGDGELRKEIENMPSRNVIFLGFLNQTQLPSLYAISDVFVLPSNNEPWGLAVNEAMAAGTAIVVSDEVGCAYDLVDEYCGAISKAGDVADLASKLLYVIDNSDNMKENAKNKIKSFDFNSDIMGLMSAISYINGRKQ